MRKKKIFTLVIIQLLFVVIFGAVTQREKLSTRQDYILIAWNDLGMHCANQDFSKVVVLPPFNTLYAQVIKKGSVSALPQVLTDSLTLSYEIPGNTYSVGKTNF